MKRSHTARIPSTGPALSRVFVLTAGLGTAIACLPLSALDEADPASPTLLSEGDEVVPAGLPVETTTWPNRASRRNSDPWLREHHDSIRSLRPRVLVLNFANDVDMPGIRDRTERFIRALAAATTHHGFADATAPAFLNYEVVSYVDLRDDPVPEAHAHDTSSLFPRKADPSADVLCDYSRFYTEDFAKRLGFRDPRDPARFLNLHELVGFGVVHEMWFYAIHAGAWPGLETIELKQYYDERLEPVKDRHGPAGNGHDDTMPWSGRSFRIAFFNPHRGTGCAMENFGHTLEGIANHGAIAYYRRYFNEYAELDLDRRYGLPFPSLYALGGDNFATYPGEVSLEIHRGDDVFRIAPYVAMGGNVHFPPGGRRDYDKDSPHRVKSVMENYRLRNGPEGKDRAIEFHHELFARYEEVAPDCMGSWVVRWCQCMPGLGNRAVDDEGQAMKNWWPFLFY